LFLKPNLGYFEISSSDELESLLKEPMMIHLSADLASPTWESLHLLSKERYFKDLQSFLVARKLYGAV